MQKRTNYNTKQKDEILDTIKKMNKAFLIKELYVKLNEKVGLTTIYRFIDKMVENEELYKYIGEDNNTYYQYLEKCDCNNHFYLKCINCGKLCNVKKISFISLKLIFFLHLLFRIYYTLYLLYCSLLLAL